MKSIPLYLDQSLAKVKSVLLYLHLELEGGSKVKCVFLYLHLRLEGGAKVKSVLLYLDQSFEKVTPLYLHLRLEEGTKVCKPIPSCSLLTS